MVMTTAALHLKEYTLLQTIVELRELEQWLLAESMDPLHVCRSAYYLLPTY
jgi:hypothetical protein